jgi:CubicO group peptidase (beta-lactamase class C family)
VERVLTPLRQTKEQGMTGFSQVDEVLGSAIERGDVPGVVAMAAARDGVVYQAAFGRRALSAEAAMSTDTVFWIASMTKAITSAAAMQLVEQGKLALDHQIADVLPELSTPQYSKALIPLANRDCGPPNGQSRLAICSPILPGLFTKSGMPRWAGTWK